MKKSILVGCVCVLALHAALIMIPKAASAAPAASVIIGSYTLNAGSPTHVNLPGAVFSTDGLTSTLTLTAINQPGLSLSADGDLTILVQEMGNALQSIDASGALTIRGSNTAALTLKSNVKHGLQTAAGKPLVIDGVTLDITASGANHFGIAMEEADLILRNGATLSVTAQDGYGIFLHGSAHATANLTVEDGSMEAACQGLYHSLLIQGDITLKKGRIKGSNDSGYPGVAAYKPSGNANGGRILLYGGTLAGYSTGNGSHTHGVESAEGITMTGGTLIAESENGYGLYSQGPIALNGSGSDTPALQASGKTAGIYACDASSQHQDITACNGKITGETSGTAAVDAGIVAGRCILSQGGIVTGIASANVPGVTLYGNCIISDEDSELLGTSQAHIGLMIQGDVTVNNGSISGSGLFNGVAITGKLNMNDGMALGLTHLSAGTSARYTIGLSAGEIIMKGQAALAGFGGNYGVFASSAITLSDSAQLQGIASGRTLGGLDETRFGTGIHADSRISFSLAKGGAVFAQGMRGTQLVNGTLVAIGGGITAGSQQAQKSGQILLQGAAKAMKSLVPIPLSGNASETVAMGISGQVAPLVEIAAEYDIDVQCGANGSITPSGILKAFIGDTVCFTITPHNGYRVKRIAVNGIEIATDNSFSVDILGDTIIAVEFGRIAQGGMPSPSMGAFPPAAASPATLPTDTTSPSRIASPPPATGDITGPMRWGVLLTFVGLALYIGASIAYKRSLAKG